MSGFAKTNNYGKGGKGYKQFKLLTPKGDETTSAMYRILPAKGKLADSGKWAVYVGTHFGYKVRDRNDPTKLSLVPFKCMQEKRNGTVTRPCAECDLIEKKKRQFEVNQQKYKEAGKTDEEIRLLLGPLQEFLDTHSCNRKWKLLVVNESNEPGVLELRHKCKQALDAQIQIILERKHKDASGRTIDPLDIDTGVFFNFRTSGRGRNIQDTVEVVKKKVVVQGEEFEKVAPAPLSEDFANSLLEILPDLTDVVRTLSDEQVERLAKCSGDPEEVESIVKSASGREESHEEQPRTKAKTTPQLKADPKPEPKPAAKPAPQEEDEEDGGISEEEYNKLFEP